ncbi:hypothetical protein [Sphingomonas baiyangensis]|uniref:Uncharacterized protein n=1 Tax=Sphingomonas baiyangensis TaxID=2572576 RepID=A0A4U1L4J5_9SPHN|nr:hypothetical protein [Sphingomonas baiyangensis]TKD51847.1 hypothetical protein FBR43_14635 [Sphingomonas baiyangensis]
MGKRRVVSSEIEAAPTLPILLPASAHQSDPISWGSSPELYSADALKKVATRKHGRTDEFEKRLMGIWWALGRPVPYLFKTADGVLRSLDAGCLGFLLNRERPEIDVIEKDGYVSAVTPIGDLTVRYELVRDRLIAEVNARR